MSSLSFPMIQYLRAGACTSGMSMYDSVTACVFESFDCPQGSYYWSSRELMRARDAPAAACLQANQTMPLILADVQHGGKDCDNGNHELNDPTHLTGSCVRQDNDGHDVYTCVLSEVDCDMSGGTFLDDAETHLLGIVSCRLCGLTSAHDDLADMVVVYDTTTGTNPYHPDDTSATLQYVRAGACTAGKGLDSILTKCVLEAYECPPDSYYWSSRELTAALGVPAAACLQAAQTVPLVSTTKMCGPENTHNPNYLTGSCLHVDPVTNREVYTCVTSQYGCQGLHDNAVYLTEAETYQRNVVSCRLCGLTNEMDDLHDMLTSTAFPVSSDDDDYYIQSNDESDNSPFASSSSSGGFQTGGIMGLVLAFGIACALFFWLGARFGNRSAAVKGAWQQAEQTEDKHFGDDMEIS